MKNLLVAGVISVLSLFRGSTGTNSSRALSAEGCSCVGPNGSCLVSTSCQGGYIAHCAGEGNCIAECSGFYEMFGMKTTLEMQNATYPQLVAVLAGISGNDIAFSPTKPDAVFNAGWKRATLWDVLDILSDRGTVQIAGKDFEKVKRLRKALLSGTKISLCVRNTPVNTFVSDMASLTGLPFRITAGRSTAVVNLELQHVSLNEILVKVSEQTSTTIIERGALLESLSKRHATFLSYRTSRPQAGT